jgi:hypothetical protein
MQCSSAVKAAADERGLISAGADHADILNKSNHLSLRDNQPGVWLSEIVSTMDLPVPFTATELPEAIAALMAIRAKQTCFAARTGSHDNSSFRTTDWPTTTPPLARRHCCGSAMVVVVCPALPDS